MTSSLMPFGYIRICSIYSRDFSVIYCLHCYSSDRENDKIEHVFFCHESPISQESEMPLDRVYQNCSRFDCRCSRRDFLLHAINSGGHDALHLI